LSLKRDLEVNHSFKLTMLEFLSEEDGLKFVEELVFEDGGVYKG